jgi:uncharacterized membrane-anchored protein YhcB (DUF1043 family)
MIYEIESWTLIKLLGGFAFVIVAAIGFLSKIFLTKVAHSSQHSYNRRLEDIKGEIDKSNNLLNSITSNYFSASQKIVDKKIIAYEILWKNFQRTREDFPSGISLVYQLLHDDEIEKENAYEDLDSNPKMGPVLRKHSQHEEMRKMIDTTKELTDFRIYLSEKSYALVKSYQGIIFRVTHMFIWEYEKKKLYQWKKDDAIITYMKSNFNEKEIAYINGIKVGALDNVLNLFEYKILKDIKKNLLITDSENDSIAYLKELQDKITSP